MIDVNELRRDIDEIERWLYPRLPDWFVDDPRCRETLRRRATEEALRRQRAGRS